MSGKKIYSDELKLKMVEKYLGGQYSYNDIANEIHCNKSDIIKWVSAYREHGVSGLSTTHNTVGIWKRTYDEQGKEALYINRRGKSKIDENATTSMYG